MRVMFVAAMLMSAVVLATEEPTVSLEEKVAFCEALEYAIDHPDGFDNDVYVCAAQYTRQHCLNAEFRSRGDGHVFAHFTEITCDCGAALMTDDDGRLVGTITGCA